MNLDQIATKCFILALFIRDDGQRLLLGDGYYDFNQKLQHFQANTIANDIVEIQGDNGQLLAGQVMRSGAQKFEGYIGDATTSRQIIEQKRSDFMAFFRIKHFYKVIYIFPDGTAIQRQRGYLTDAPTIPEIFQKFPEYSVALNFEDANYYEYAEDEHGDEIYAHIAELALAGETSGGLIWDAIGAVTNGITWSGIQTAQGEYIQITNDLSLEAPLASVEMLGKAEQTTYSGKNLLGILSTNRTATRNGVTITLADDGKITLNGTATGNMWPDLSYNIQVNTVEHEDCITYYDQSQAVFSVTVVGGTKTTSAGGFYLAYNDNSAKQTNISFADPSFTPSTSATYGINRAWLYIANGSVFNNYSFYLQVEKGSTATSFEKFVGGVPAPNPDYPQPISVVTGENVVKIEGKNLCPDTSEGYWVGSAGTNAGRTANDSGVAIPVQPNTYYTVSTTTTQARYRCAWSDSTTTIGGASLTTASFFSADNTSESHTGSSGSHKYLIINATNLSAIQLELGNSASQFEPFQAQEFEVNLGKNLLDPDSISQGTWINASPTNTCTFFMPIYTGETFTISNQDTATYRFSCGLCATPHAGTNTQDSGWQTGTSYTITAQSNGYLYVQLRKNDTSTITPSTTPTDVYMVERGSQATSFAPYFTPIELAKIGNYQDRIYKTGGKWYIEKNVGKVVLDGTESGWAWADTARYTIATSNIGAREAISDHFTYVNYTGHASTASPSFDISSNLASIGFHNKDITSLNNFKTWLASNPTTVYYALATPTTTEITNEALVAQLDALGASSLYLGVNNIGTETLNAMPTLKIEYYTEYTLEGAGYEWEPGGNTARTIVTVAGVDSAWPIWTIQGGAQNPTLTNITTGQTISWQGFVPEGQTLTINMAEMTADLAGANVFEYITGEWIRLAPGNNTLVYNAGSADKPSTLSWNGVLA